MTKVFGGKVRLVLLSVLLCCGSAPAIDVGLVVFGVVDSHCAGVDVRFERVDRIRQVRQDVGHREVPCGLRENFQCRVGLSTFTARQPVRSARVMSG